MSVILANTLNAVLGLLLFQQFRIRVLALIHCQQRDYYYDILIETVREKMKRL